MDERCGWYRNDTHETRDVFYETDCEHESDYVASGPYCTWCGKRIQVYCIDSFKSVPLAEGAKAIGGPIQVYESDWPPDSADATK
jgi:hypothetical protein